MHAWGVNTAIRLSKQRLHHECQSLSQNSIDKGVACVHSCGSRRLARDEKACRHSESQHPDGVRSSLHLQPFQASNLPVFMLAMQSQQQTNPRLSDRDASWQ